MSYGVLEEDRMADCGVSCSLCLGSCIGGFIAYGSFASSFRLAVTS